MWRLWLAVVFAVQGWCATPMVAAGTHHGVWLKADGTVWTWGFYSYWTPAPVSAVRDVVQVAAGTYFTVALRQDGTVWAWGEKPVTQVPIPVAVRAIAARGDKTWAMDTDGRVWSWGKADVVAVRSEVDFEAMVRGWAAADAVMLGKAGAIGGVVSVAGASTYGLALTSKDEVWAWGSSASGVLGADPEDRVELQEPEVVGTALPRCGALFACAAEGGRNIEICTVTNEEQRDIGVHYRFGRDVKHPELIYPRKPLEVPAALYFSHERKAGEYRMYVRFVNGGYTYQVYVTADSGAGVEVTDRQGRRVARIRCTERPKVFGEDLRKALSCDAKGPGCADRPRDTK